MAQTTNLNENTCLISFKNDLRKKPGLKKVFEKLYTDRKGDWSAINKALKRNKRFSAKVVNYLSFADELVKWTDANNTQISYFQNNKCTNPLNCRVL